MRLGNALIAIAALSSHIGTTLAHPMTTTSSKLFERINIPRPNSNTNLSRSHQEGLQPTIHLQPNLRQRTEGDCSHVSATKRHRHVPQLRVQPQEVWQQGRRRTHASRRHSQGTGPSSKAVRLGFDSQVETCELVRQLRQVHRLGDSIRYSVAHSGVIRGEQLSSEEDPGEGGEQTVALPFGTLVQLVRDRAQG